MLLTCAAGLGTAVLAGLGRPGERPVEFRALAGAAGLGTLAVLLGGLGLAGRLGWARWLIPAGALATLLWFARRRRWPRPAGRLSWAAAALGALLLAAALGAMAPVTESDSLAYPLPIARRLAQEGAWRFWPDLVRSVFPASRHVLTAALLDLGVERVGLLSAAELALAAVLIGLLARRLASRGAVPEAGEAARWVAPLIALGCPAVAFLAAAAKEDLLLLVMTAAAALALSLPPAPGTAAAAGLFAGFAAGAKYTGLPVALAVLACVPFCCGRRRRLPGLTGAILAAAGAGGLWYAVNLVRFGNPVAPFLPSVGHFPLAAAAGGDLLPGFGGRLLDAGLAPVLMMADLAGLGPGRFGGRGNWLNPLIWLGLVYAVSARRRLAIYWPLVVIALALYATWLAGSLAARLLVPAAGLLAVPAADALVAGWRRCRPARPLIGLALALSVGIVVAVGGLRAARYAADPGGFVGRETPHHGAIEWMNRHLDPARHRVATWLPPSGYLRIPWMNLTPSFQVEIAPAELADPARLRAALQRQGFTHVFGSPGRLDGLEPWLTPVHLDPESSSGTSFFRPSSREPVGVYALR